MREIAERCGLPDGHRQEPHLVRAALAAARARGDGGADDATATHVRARSSAATCSARSSPTRPTAVRAHLADCPECAAEHAALAGLPGAARPRRRRRRARRRAARRPRSRSALLDRFAARAGRAAAAPAPAGCRRGALARRRRVAGGLPPPRRGRRGRASRTRGGEPRAPATSVALQPPRRAHGAPARAGLRRAPRRHRRVHLWVTGLPARPRRRLRGPLRRAGLERQRRHVPRRRARHAPTSCSPPRHGAGEYDRIRVVRRAPRRHARSRRPRRASCPDPDRRSRTVTTDGWPARGSRSRSALAGCGGSDSGVSSGSRQRAARRPSTPARARQLRRRRRQLALAADPTAR